MPVVVQAEARGDERGALLAYLEAQRGGIRRALHNLTEEQARSAPAASELSVAALLKHVTVVESGWVRTFQGIEATEAEKKEEWENSFTPSSEETIEELIAFSERVAAETERAVRAVASLDETFVVPPAPWDKGGDFSWRWGLLHLIEEVARHAGHADVIRETIDGKGAFDLVFETGAMPEPDWTGFESQK
ncbi:MULTISPECIES: DinB family protein [unclassified Streptomyces]|uniref:DinB family protein n=1 Tax=unclassified Streptomyces TaxID=2593676 RepID=UPI002DDA85F4|nr:MULTISPECIES: DinB family protein [unclassified Streptomyces]WSA93221.1 DinB family protein [Streptomyces sp. NBC_01795]WSB77592.1 DinB family protein [Streptomyces sp. NBC_01775]WSS14141.1 DinB family protein [Streptomyces sp. NBC_01186]WSS42963.1 DinB family protein [Streptomyces sp. NBC_01187]